MYTTVKEFGVTIYIFFKEKQRREPKINQEYTLYIVIAVNDYSLVFNEVST